MSNPLQLPRFSLGVGDRFGHQAHAQLRACVLAAEQGVHVTPVWNKSNREHTLIGSHPAATRAAAEAAVRDLHWEKPFFVDADHIQLTTYERLVAPCDFFTLDVADTIGQPADEHDLQAFLHRHPELTGTLAIPGIEQPFALDRAFLERTARHYLAAVQQAGRIFRKLVEHKGEGRFITEISMDETEVPQTPPELLVLLAALADEQIPVQTLAPKFTGRFNKGVDYVGDPSVFAREFRDDLATIAHAIALYRLPPTLKLSVHSGSDKFALYRPIHDALLASGAGVHVKTAGTTWLEELIGLAEGGPDGLAVAKQVYAEAYAHRDELCAPYASVVAIDPAGLPTPQQVNTWTPEQFVRALRHNAQDPEYNPNLRQLLHVGFKIAASMGPRYLEALEAHQAVIAHHVTANLLKRHILPLFPSVAAKP